MKVFYTIFDGKRYMVVKGKYFDLTHNQEQYSRPLVSDKNTNLSKTNLMKIETGFVLPL